MRLDPLAENYSFQSPYVYANNNPTTFIDFLGLSVDTTRVYDSNCTLIAQLNSENPNDEITLDQITVDPEREPTIINDLPETMDPRMFMCKTAYGRDRVQAVSLNFSGQFALKYGGQIELSIIAMIDGDNKGDYGIALQTNVLLGLEGSVAITGSLFWNEKADGDLGLKDLRGWEKGIQGGALVSTFSYGKGFTSIFDHNNATYTVRTAGLAFGIEELPIVTGSIYLGVSGFIYWNKKGKGEWF